jgi:hypothetical protein
MNDEVIKNFLSLPGIACIALTQAHVVSRLYIAPQASKTHQEDVLTKILTQVVAASPADFDFFESYTTGYYIYLYKLNIDHSLAIMAHIDVVAIKLLAGKQLQRSLQKSISSEAQESSPPKESQSSVALLAESEQQSQDTQTQNLTLEDALNALNLLNQIVSEYLGPTITANYWQSTQPKHLWIESFQVNRSGQFIFSDISKKSVTIVEQLQLRDWTHDFMTKCSQIIRDLPVKIEHKITIDRYRRVLSIMPDDYKAKEEYLPTADNSLF